MEPHIQKNIERWNAEQARKHRKAENRKAQAISQLTRELGREPREREVRERVGFILSERRAKFLLKECRATITEIVAAAQRKQEGKNG